MAREAGGSRRARRRPVVAVCGLGLMGSQIAHRLLSRGHSVTVWNRSAEKVRALVELGATPSLTPAEAARRADTVLTVLSDDRAVVSVMLGEDGIAAGAPAVVVDLSTVAPATSANIAASLPAETAYLDAPMLGSIDDAGQGTLRILAGGDAWTLERGRPILDDLGEVVHVGPLGAGVALKLVVNTAVTPMIALLAEALTLADGLGLSIDVVLDELERSRIGPLVRRKRQNLESGAFPPNARLRTFAKDLRLSLEAGRRAGAELTVVEAVASVADAAVAAGFGDADYSALVAYVRERGPDRLLRSRSGEASERISPMKLADG